MSYVWFFALMIFISFISVLFNLVAPIMVQVWKTSAEGVTVERILILSIIMAIFLGLNILFIIVKEYYSRKLNRDNFFSYLKSMLEVNYDYILNEGVMKVLEKTILNVNNIYKFITGDNIKLITNTFVIIAISIWMIMINKYIFLISFMVVPINILGFAKINKVLFVKSQKMQAEVTGGWQKVLSVISNVEYVKQMSDEETITNYLEATVNNIYTAMSDVNMYAVSVSTLISGINLIFQTVILTYGVYNFAIVGNDYFSLMILTILVPTFFSTLASIVGSRLNKRDFILAKEFKKELEKMKESYQGENIEKIDNIKFNIKKLELPKHTIDVNIEGEFTKGDIVRVRGESGRGKSTFLKALVGLRECEGIYINDKDIKTYNVLSLRKRIEYMSQDAYIFQGTLEDNLFFGNEKNESRKKELKNDKLLKSVFTSKTYDSNILNLGADLSGGERQKIALARAINSQADVILLDEITSSVDKESSIEIYNRIREVSKDKIVFVISHDDLVESICNRYIEI